VKYLFKISNYSREYAISDRANGFWTKKGDKSKLVSQRKALRVSIKQTPFLQ